MYGFSFAIEPLVSDDFKFPFIVQQISCDGSSFLFNCANDEDFLNKKCYTGLYAYEVYLFKLNDDWTVSKTFTHQYVINDCNTLQTPVVNPTGVQPGDYVDVSSIPIGMGDFGRQSGLPPALTPGYWAVGIAENSNGWKYTSRPFYVLPDSLVQNSAAQDTVSKSLIASGSITLENVLVPDNSDILVGASSYVNLEQGSHLQSGHYFIEDIGCSNYPALRTSNPNTGSKSNPALLNNEGIPAGIPSKPLANTAATIKNNPAILLYPNPTNNSIIADFKNSNFTGTNDINLQVFNSLGQLVQSQAVLLNGNVQLTVNLSTLNAGMYTIIISQAGKIFQNKIVKQ